MNGSSSLELLTSVSRHAVRCMWWQAFVLVCPDEALALILPSLYRRLLSHESRYTVHRASFQPTITGIANIDFRSSRKSADYCRLFAWPIEKPGWADRFKFAPE